MMVFKRFIRGIPYWAYLLILLSIVCNTIYFIYKQQAGIDCQSNHTENGKCIIDHVTPGGAAAKAGIRPGDILLTIDSIDVREWASVYRGVKAGDTCLYEIIRDGQKMEFPLIFSSQLEFNYGFLLAIYIILILLSIAGLYLLFKKPHDKAVRLFFIFLQLFAVTQNADYLTLREPFAMAASFVFFLSTCLFSPLLLHFHLLFPRPAKIYNRFGKWTIGFYVVGILVTLWWYVSYHNMVMNELKISTFRLITRLSLLWMISTYFLAVAVVILQFITIKETFSRNQLRLVIIGSFFGIYTAIPIVFFDGWVQQINAKYPYLIFNIQGIGSLMMIGCILVAIFRYRIWDIEIFFRKALLYLSATFIIIFTYLFLIFFVDSLAISETNFSRFLILGISVVVFLVQRDRIQRMIDRIFHRESYDSATVVSDFEDKLSGIYHLDELKCRIGHCLDEIFHFKTFVFNLRKNDLSYEPVCIIGLGFRRNTMEFDITPEFELKLRSSQIFSPDELNLKDPILEMTKGELIVPLLSGGKPDGFFICGPKKSEKVYSLQDIKVLSLLARRVIALLNTAGLYQNYLERQLMLERERARISQDMHDDIGAGLTKIAMISEATAKFPDSVLEIKEKMSKVASTAREMIARLNIIVWALNPQNDRLDTLFAYIRRHFGEYLENFGIQFKMEAPEVVPEISITPDFRRNAFYAVQEAIHNSAKHGACSEIILELKINQPNIRITITDNGKGFDQSTKSSNGNGLINMKKRAEEMGGSFEMQSSPGKGTSIIFNVNLPENTTKG